MSGLSRTPGKRVRVNSPPRVRIPPAPPTDKQLRALAARFAFRSHKKTHEEENEMKCPHCQVQIHPTFGVTELNGGSPIGAEAYGATRWNVGHMACPNPKCGKAILNLSLIQAKANFLRHQWPIYPQGQARTPAAPEVPADLAEDYDEAGKVLTISPKASAALTRRCLQSLLRSQGFDQKDLAPAIAALIASKTIPSWLAQNVDAIRNIGNFAAHPLKDSNGGEILPVETHEADWNLEVLESLFDFYYVQPAHDAERRAALNEKLKAAGKPEMK
jgi:hypothetical protein